MYENETQWQWHRFGHPHTQTHWSLRPNYLVRFDRLVVESKWSTERNKVFFFTSGQHTTLLIFVPTCVASTYTKNSFAHRKFVQNVSFLAESFLFTFILYSLRLATIFFLFLPYFEGFRFDAINVLNAFILFWLSAKSKRLWALFRSCRKQT